MTKTNEFYNDLKGSYLFSEIAKRVQNFSAENPDKKILRLGIGDVTRPLPDSVIKAMHNAVDEMADAKLFQGYGPEQGYDFLRNAISQHDYKNRGINIEANEIFVSDGAKSDCGNIGDIFSADNIVAIGDPVYPVYLDTNVMGGRAGKPMSDGRYDKIVYMSCTEENGFMPEIPNQKVDIIYLCFPNNPTGVTATKEYLKKWVDYANENKSIILYDSAYEAFIQDENIPRSIFEVEGARTCAIEFRSYSKTAGFTGTRCAYTVVPMDLILDEIRLNDLWLRRQTTKFNGVPYIVQRGAFATYSDEGKAEVKEAIDYYMNNARTIYKGLNDMGLKVFGGENAPYVWVGTPKKQDSWELFDNLLNNAGVVVTPGVGFGACGQGFIRFSAFAAFETVQEALERIKNIF